MLNARRYYTIPKDEGSLVFVFWFLFLFSFFFLTTEGSADSCRQVCFPALKGAKARYPCAFLTCAGY
jgi:hypothetical protein